MLIRDPYRAVCNYSAFSLFTRKCCYINALNVRDEKNWNFFHNQLAWNWGNDAELSSFFY